MEKKPPTLWISPGQACEYLGWKDRRTILKYIDKGLIRGKKKSGFSAWGDRYLVDFNSIQKFLTKKD